tara:strand:- start:756 stop:932 length:177 start_codon:yes stop_codon:yes gene_type:complete
MDPFKKRVTKNDKKAKKGLYTQKYIRLKHKTLNINNKKEDGSLQSTEHTLQPNGRVNV